MTNSSSGSSFTPGLVQKAEIGALHHRPPSSIKKWNSGTLFGMELKPNTPTSKYLSCESFWSLR